MGRYYYAGGRRIAIAPDADHVAINTARARAAGLGGSVESLAAQRAPAVRRLPAGVLLATRETVAPPLLVRLRRAAALLPVYRRAEALLVALPEIRVELEEAGQRESVLAWVARAPHPVRLVSATHDRLLLEPESESAEHAIDLANDLHEAVKPLAASVRFLQVVPRPVRSR